MIKYTNSSSSIELLQKFNDSQAFGASEAVLVVGFSKNCHHFSFDDLPTGVALGAKEALVVSTTVMSTIFCVETISGKRLLALCNAAARHDMMINNHEKAQFPHNNKYSVHIALPTPNCSKLTLMLHFIRILSSKTMLN